MKNTLINLLPPTLMNKDQFQTLELLGQGAFGKVYKVLNGNTVYAMKCIKKQTLMQFHKVDQAKLELQIMYSLDHPHILKLHSHFEDEDYVYLILDYVEKGNLYDVIKQHGNIREHYAIYYLRQVVDGIIYLHSQAKPILHRDIKPENILLNDLGQVKLADFGSANALQQESKRTTLTGTTIYMAPEILEGEGYDQTVDIWSLGVLVYELLIGKSPFEVSGIDIPEHQRNTLIIQNIKSINYTFPVEFPPLARDLVRKMLKRDPDQRIALKDVLDHPWIKQPIEIDQQNKVTILDKKERIKLAIMKHKNSQSQNNEKFQEMKQKIIDLKSQINNTQVEILKGQLENQVLSEKLKEIENSSVELENEESPLMSVVSPSQIKQIEIKFNKLNIDIMKLQKEIIENGTNISKDIYKVELAELLKNKVSKEQVEIEKIERELVVLSNQKKLEQQKQDEVYNIFTSLNNERSVEDNEDVEDNYAYITQLKELIEKVKNITSQHKNIISNPSVEDSILHQSDDDDNSLDDEIDDRVNQLQKQYEEQKKQYQQELEEEVRELHSLEEYNQKLKVQVRNLQAKEKCIEKAQQIYSNLDFSYKIKQDKIKDLKQQIDKNDIKIRELSDDFEMDTIKYNKMP